MCLNKRVLIGLGLAALAVLALAPRALAAAGPILLLAACPLSMVLMMRSMSGHKGSPASSSSEPPEPESAKAPDEAGSSAQPVLDHGAQLRRLEDELARLRAEVALRDRRSVS